MKLHADIENIENIMPKLEEMINENNSSNFFSGINEIKKQLDDLNTEGWKGNDSTTFYNNYINYLDYIREVFLSYRKLVLIIEDANSKYRNIDDLRNYYVEDNSTFNLATKKETAEPIEQSEIVGEGD